MHGHGLVEPVRAEHGAVRLEQLGADQQRLHPAGREEGKRGEEEHDSDPLVVDGGQPPHDPGALLPNALESIDAGLGGFREGDGHGGLVDVDQRQGDEGREVEVALLDDRRLLQPLDHAEERDERRILLETDEVVQQGRDHAADRLGDDHVAERLPSREPQ